MLIFTRLGWLWNTTVFGYIRALAVLLTLPLLLLTSCSNDDKNDKAYAEFFDHLVSTYDKKGGHPFFEKIDSAYRSVPDPSGYFRFRACGFHALVYYYGDKQDSMQLYIDSCLHILEQYHLTQKYSHEYANTLNGKGDYFYNTGEIEKAFEYYSRSLTVSRAQHIDSCAIGNLSYHLGMVSYRQEKYQLAAGYFNEAFIEISLCVHDSGNYYRLQEILSDAALAYVHLNKQDTARIYFYKALNFIDTEGSKYNDSRRFRILSETARGVVLGNLAKTYIATGALDTAEQLLKQSIAINSRPGYENSDAKYTKMQLAELYYKQGRTADVNRLQHEIRVALDTVPDKAVELRWRRMQYQYYTSLKEFETANAFVQSYIGLRDSLDVAAKTLKKTDYAQLLKEMETQNKVKLLVVDNELKRLYLWISFGLVAVIIVIMGLVYYNYKKTRKNIQVLTVLNNLVNVQKADLEKVLAELKLINEDKDRILRIVAHDLRTPIGAIMMISSLIIDEEMDEARK